MSDEAKKTFSVEMVPWQIWVVVVLLSLEGIGDLLQIPLRPVAAFWLAAKVFFIIGLLRKWKWVYVIFVIVAVLHVVIFAMAGVFLASLINSVLILLVLFAFCSYCPIEIDDSDNGEIK
jgi:nicotinamide riboside transporter PnuC